MKAYHFKESLLYQRDESEALPEVNFLEKKMYAFILYHRIVKVSDVKNYSIAALIIL